MKKWSALLLFAFVLMWFHLGLNSTSIVKAENVVQDQISSNANNTDNEPTQQAAGKVTNSPLSSVLIFFAVCVAVGVILVFIIYSARKSVSIQPTNTRDENN